MDGMLRTMQICLTNRSCSPGAEGLFDVFKKPVEGAKKDGFFGFTTGALPTSETGIEGLDHLVFKG